MRKDKTQLQPLHSTQHESGSVTGGAGEFHYIWEGWLSAAVWERFPREEKKGLSCYPSEESLSHVKAHVLPMLQLDFTPNLTHFPVSSPMLTFSKKIHKPSSQLWPWLTLEIFISRISHGHIRRALSLQQIQRFLLLDDWYGQSSKSWQLVLVINGDFSTGFFCCCCHFVLVLRPIYFSINVWEIELMVHGMLFVYRFTIFLHGWSTTFCCMLLFLWSQLLFSFHF